METYLPTFTSASWTVASLRESLQREISSDTNSTTLLIFAYAVTEPGWREVRPAIRAWMRARNGRSVVAYVGTDHALTEPDALCLMRKDGVRVRIMRKYNGVYHPKVFWLKGGARHSVWVGSNNLTREGLLHNVEFATLIRSRTVPAQLRRWLRSVAAASEPLDEGMLASYLAERREFAGRRSSAGTFTWSRREGSVDISAPRLAHRPQRKSRRRTLPVQRGDLVVEVMPRETGLDGKQMQLPKEAAAQFFGLPDRVAASREITLSPVGTSASRTLRMTLFRNSTTRLSLHELDYRDRPCVLVFHRTRRSEYQFEIVQQSVFPTRYRDLLGQCGNQTRSGSRRWAILENNRPRR